MFTIPSMSRKLREKGKKLLLSFMEKLVVRSEFIFLNFYCKMAACCSGILNEDFTTKHDHAKWAISLGN
jgi:hypothetical protein